MKRVILVLCLLWGVWASAAGAAGSGAVGPDTLFVSVSQTVHLRFASELKYVNLGSRVLVAKMADGARDFLAVKAREEFGFCTSLSCLESNGEMHTFVVAYWIRLLCENLFYKDDVLYLVVTVDGRDLNSSRRL